MPSALDTRPHNNNQPQTSCPGRELLSKNAFYTGDIPELAGVASRIGRFFLPPMHLISDLPEGNSERTRVSRRVKSLEPYERGQFAGRAQSTTWEDFYLLRLIR
jgi:hypothetical protein